MAELVAKKSSNVVSNNSNKKNSDVCSVQSNNGLIDLDNITASNNQLITLCDEPEDEDDLIMTKNTKNELSPEDKSLQEMIESELALRICSANNDDNDDLLDIDEDEASHSQPEITIKKIILEPRPDPLDINAEFIGAEMEHYTIVEDPYTYRNGHTSPGFGESRSPERPLVVDEQSVTSGKCEQRDEEEFAGPLAVDETTSQSVNLGLVEGLEAMLKDSESVRPEDDVVEDEILVQSEKEPSWSNSVDTFKNAKDPISDTNEDPCILEEDDNRGSPIVLDKHRQEENDQSQLDDERTEAAWAGMENTENGSAEPVESQQRKNLDYPDVWLDSTATDPNAQIGNFSDDFAVSPSREQNPIELEEPEDDQHREYDAKTGIDNMLIDVDEDSKAEADAGFTSENNRDLNADGIVDVDATVEESEKTSESCPSGDSSQIEVLPSNVDGQEKIFIGEMSSQEIANTRSFIGEERVALAKESQEVSKILNENAEAEVASVDDKTSELSTKDDDRLCLEKDVRVFGNDPKSYPTTEGSPGQDEEREECESSWMTVEEATNDRNKLAETMNELSAYEDANEITDERSVVETGTVSVQRVQTRTSTTKTTTTTSTTTNGHEGSLVSEPEINFVVATANVDTDEYDDESSYNNQTKIDNSCVKNDPTATNATSRLLLSNDTVVAPLATPDDESSEFSNVCDSESREEVITSSSVVTSSTTSTKTSTKTKKKKIEGVAGNDASPNQTPRTKKTKKSKKNDLEKENISVNINAEDPSMHTGRRQMSQEMDDFSDEDDLSNVNVKSLTQSYVSETSRGEQEKSNKEVIETGVSIKQLCRSFGDISNMTDVDQAAFGLSEQTSETQEKSSFNKFDALSKKSVLHVRSADTAKTQQQLNSVGQNGDANPNCRSCGKVVFQMEQTKAEGLVWHKNCFRCVQCSKQLNVDNYQSHESTLYCKAHFKELFQPKPVEESDQPVRPRKPEMIIRENQPKELPPDVVRASDKPDLGLEELSSLNVKSRFQVFEKTTNDTTNEIERSPSQVVKRSPSILSKLAKFQAKGMDIGVADDSLNGIPFEESSESEEEEEIEESEELDTEIIKAKRQTRERPISFTKMDDIKNRWECTSQQGRRESQREARKEEIAGIRSRLFMGKQGKMKEMYQQAVAESERVTKTNPTEEIQHSTHARSIKERFERGEPIATSDDETDAKPKQEKPDEEVIAAGISRKSRSLFLELDASAAKTGRPVTPVNPKTPTDVSRRARDQIGSPEREIYRDPDVVRADDRVDEVVHTDTARKMLSIFRQMEEQATKEDIPDGPKPLKRFTPPPEDKFAKATASESEDEDEEEGEESEEEESGEERDPNYVRASDKVEDEFLKQAQNAARAKTLRAKFEQWETTDGKVTSHHVAEMDMAQGNGDQASIESASSLRARFESLGSQPSDAPRAPKVKVNRFVEIQTICMDVCESCQKKVYPLEKVETNNKIFHKQCFRCLQCNCVLRMDTFTLNNGKLYCIPHFKQLFIARGNYDEGFGVDPHKNKWATNNTNTSAVPATAPVAVSNGRATSVANRV